MIKATGGTKDGKRKFAIFGLSEMNLAKLREGKPIHVFGAELGLSHDIIIFWGETEEAMAKQMTEAYGVQPERPSKQ